MELRPNTVDLSPWFPPMFVNGRELLSVLLKDGQCRVIIVPLLAIHHYKMCKYAKTTGAHFQTGVGRIQDLNGYSLH